METSDGGWMVIQRNIKDKVETFNKGWSDYEQGFGDLELIVIFPSFTKQLKNQQIQISTICILLNWKVMNWYIFRKCPRWLPSNAGSCNGRDNQN